MTNTATIHLSENDGVVSVHAEFDPGLKLADEEINLAQYYGLKTMEILSGLVQQEDPDAIIKRLAEPEDTGGASD